MARDTAGAANNGTEKKCADPARAVRRLPRPVRRTSTKQIPMTAKAVNSPTQWAQGLGYGGLIPFVGLALAIWLLDPTDPADRARGVSALLGYGATILSFLGAVHWGLVMRQASGQSLGLLVWGVAPSLFAWLALLINPAAGLWLIAAGLWACFLVDRMVYPKFGVRAWLPMRLALTLVASLSCIAGAMGAMR